MRARIMREIREVQAKVWVDIMEEVREVNEANNAKRVYRRKDEVSGREYTLLMETRDGRALLEDFPPQAEAKTHLVDRDQIEEVLPHIVGVVFFSRGFRCEEGSKIYHYFAREGEVEVGDICCIEAPSGLALVLVRSVGCTSKHAREHATKYLKGFRIKSNDSIGGGL